MNPEIHKSADDWLKLNLSYEGAYRMTIAEPALSTFRLFILPLFLVVSAAVVATMWYQKDLLNLVTMTDRIGYSVLLAVTVAGALILKLRPGSIRVVMGVVVIAFITHLLTAYYTEMANRIFSGKSSSYELTILALWLPLSYVASFVFLSPRAAVRASLVMYAAISVPQFALLATEQEAVIHLVAVAILVSQPVYIASLWGVGLLKTYTLGIHEFAKNMSTAATVDTLTGIANRRALDHVLQAIIQLQPVSPRSLSLLILDVDYFKRINDTYGHTIGDEVLATLAHEASLRLRSTDLIGRWGGEEFMIISADQPAPQILQMADRLRSELEKLVYPRVGTVTVSIGVTTYIPGEDMNTLINRADNALYQAKQNGRNRVEGMF